VIGVAGVVVAEPQAPGGVEIHDPAVTVISEADEAPPFDLYRPVIKAQLPTILDNAPVALRHPAAARISPSRPLHGRFRSGLHNLGFTEIQTPKIVGSATESGATTFALDYFGKTAYLAQSPQFYKQVMVGVFERVYEVGPSSGPSRTTPPPHQRVRLAGRRGRLHRERVHGHGRAHRHRRQHAGRRRAGCRGSAGLLGLELPKVPSPSPTSTSWTPRR